VTAPAGYSVYGLRVTGLDGTRLLPVGLENQIRVAVSQSRDDPERPALGADRAVLDLPNGRQLRLDRRAGTATFTGPPLSPDELVHPYLGAVASIFNRWAGREVFHAGAFVAGGRAWAVVGGREAGKSTLLAALADRGVPVVADDLVVTDGEDVFCGPRCIDLRTLGPGWPGPVTPARGNTRWRRALPPLSPRIPLGGWIHLRWEAAAAMAPVPASVSLGRLAAGRTRPALASDPGTLLTLATRPAWDLGRRREWAEMDAVIDLVLGTVTAPEPSGLPVG
jgi:hypothetical protein